MDYKLAKQLKDAGFMKGTHYWEIRGDKTLMPFPTLSELIEACGDETINFKKMSKQDARPDNLQCVAWIGNKQGNGKTPEIAVANLYLALNKKK